MTTAPEKVVYTREALLALQSTRQGIKHLIPAELKAPYRGCRAGAMLKAKLTARRRRYKPALPSILMGNVNSLSNKSDELEALVRNQRAYRECSLMCFTESWLNNNNPDSSVDLPGFTTVRADRDASASGKNKGGGLILFVNNKWCNPGHITVKEKICCQDVELLAVGLRPYYVPREFSHIIAIVVYIPPRAAPVTACDVIHEAVARIQTQHPDAFIAISGDFNHVTLTSHLTGFVQYVNCPTRQNKTLDLLYANTKDAYTASAFPPLGRSDHNLVFLQPTYKPCVLRQPITTRTFRKWTPEASESLRDCFECTVWNVLQGDNTDTDTDINSMVDCTTDYINFCRDTVVPARTVRCYPNNKPWITSDIKALLNQKKEAFKDGDMERRKQVQQQLKRSLKQARVDYKNKVERKLQHNNTREVWRGMRTITGYKLNNSQVTAGDVDRADEFNLFYNRFDTSAGACPAPVSSASPPLLASGSPPTTSPTPPCPPLRLTHPHTSPTPPPPSPQRHPHTALPPLARPPAVTPPPTTPHSSSPNTAAATPPSPGLPLLLTTDEVRAELRRLRPRKAAGPDGVCPRLLKDCAAQLAEPLQRIFNMSLQTGRVPVLWKTSCLVPVPKSGRSVELNDYRPVALTSHIMKTLERLFLRHLRPQTEHALDPLQFGYREHIGVEDAILYMLHRAYSHLDEPGGYVRIMFFDFSSAFNTIQPPLLRDKLDNMGVDPSYTSWIIDYLTGRPQFVRLGNCVSGTVVSSTGAPQGTVLAPFLFTLYTSDFTHNTESCHIQKYSDDTAIVACVRRGQEREYRDLAAAFCDWSAQNGLLLNTTKTKEMVVDFRRSKPPLHPVNIGGKDIEVVHTYKYLGVHLDNKLDWSLNTDALYKKGQSRLFFLRRLRSFDVCREMLHMFYQSVVASVLFYAAVCWGGSMMKRDTNRLDRLVKKSGSVLGRSLAPLGTVVERRTLSKSMDIMDNISHPLHHTLAGQRSSRSRRLISLRTRTERYRGSFVPSAIRLYNTTVKEVTSDLNLDLLG